MTFYKNRFPATFGGHLEFLRETLKTLVSETVRDRAISTKFFVCRVYWRLFRKIAFPPLLAAILNFCVKRKSAFISEMVRDRAILTKFWTRRVSAESTGDILQKSLSRHFLVAIFNFCVKCETHLSGKPFEIE